MNCQYELKELGWNDAWQELFQPYLKSGFHPGRVAAEYRDRFKVWTEFGEVWAVVSGKMRYTALERSDFPAVGDWVVLEGRAESIKDHEDQDVIIQSILPRKSKFSRKAAGKTSAEQIVATNIDTVFLVNALNFDFNVRRIERYLTLAWESGANPVLVLSKTDLCDDVQEKVSQVQDAAPGVDILPISCATGDGVSAIAPYIRQGQTIALLGSSGAGKSTLVNYLLGQNVQLTYEVREKDSRGRHTTTSRELFLLPQGGVLIDTPGMREIQLFGSGEGLSEAFEDIAAYAGNCRFSDCQHESEPGCAVQKAIAEGMLSEERYESFKKLQREARYISRKTNLHEQLEEKKKWKKITQQIKEHYQTKR
ncbi:ribosome small subunit-dependent GTPase A [Desulfitobacterium hafniense DCB-2]|uniref:Small ribosomal subunit biogenesis GTPase RsgA n=1 Tax=Desulfitobacterium hafniense (strain DSM 10664 / DCB-2) TaxID=272564 RepID=B8FYJ7_DESHD|nr:ribosome small subunit-dependent GTPase A [Desulfitobacterium hafniense]ACL20920.1 ribosome small subunit-dependent GTPase A [Desulfitobacterium hafniense DCB-2]